MTIVSVIGEFTSFINGLRLVDGGELLKMAKLNFDYNDNLVALAGGAVVGATPIKSGSNRVVTCASANDSLLLPTAIPFKIVWLTNDGAQSARVFPNQSNPNNGNIADTIAPHNTSVYGASVDVAAAAVSGFLCVALGKWKSILLT